MTDPTDPHRRDHGDHGDDPDTGGRVLLDGLGRAVGVVTVLVILAGYVIGAAGCSRNPDLAREPVPSISVDTPNAVNRVCYQFFRYTRTDLSRTVVEGDMTYLAGLPGVPASIRDAIAEHYRTPGGSEPARTKIKQACVDAGWSPGTKASDQPPLR